MDRSAGSPDSSARRALLQGAASSLALLAGARAAWAAGTGRRHFPKGFLWGAATAGHQVEGNNTNSDTWFLEQMQPTVFAEPSGDACNSLELWRDDLALVSQLHLNTYRFSIEWARIEPEPGQFSVAMLDHYLRLIEGCRARGIAPMVTFNHFTSPRWFAARGGWLDAQAPALFARYCERAARHLAAPIAYATTLNEPDLMRLLQWIGMPQGVWDAQRATLAAAARALGVPRFVAANVALIEDLDAMQVQLLEAHRLGRAAIKAVRPDLPVGVSLAIVDDQAVGEHSRRDEKRAQVYGAWLEAVRHDDFVGVQNYERARIDEHGPVPPPDGVARNAMGSEIYPPSLANAVRYVHEQTGRPIMVTEHGLGTDDDALRAAFIPAALAHLADAMATGVPVLGYMHWSLVDNFEWIFGYKPHYGLCAVDRPTFKRSAKPSARVLAAIARDNAVG
jgi:beta-glucosidase